MNEIMSFAQPVNVVGTSPVLLPTPALSNKMTSRFSASLSINAGSLDHMVNTFYYLQRMNLPKVHIAPKMDVQNNWHICGFAKTSIRETNIVIG